MGYLNVTNRHLRDPKHQAGRAYRMWLRAYLGGGDGGRWSKEAGEATSAGVFGTLPPDFQRGIVEALFATAVFPQIATSWATAGPNFEIWSEDYVRVEETSFGTFAQGGSFTDGSALTNADRLYIKPTVTTVGTATFTITYTNQNGRSDVVAFVLAATVAGVINEIPLATNGDLVLDITAVTVSGWSAGTVKFFAYAPTSGATELATSGKMYAKIVKGTGSVTEYDSEIEASWQAVEDAARSLAANGPGAYQLVGRSTSIIVKLLARDIDFNGMRLLNAGSGTDSVPTANQATFNTATIPGGYSDPEWKNELNLQATKLVETIEHSSEALPTSWVINSADRHKSLWMKEIFKSNVERQNAFLQNLAIGDIAGMPVFVAFWQPHNKMLAVNRDYVFYPVYVPVQIRGPFPYVGGAKTDRYVARTRAAQKTIRSVTRGTLEFIEK
jgi:hypothetical protein